MLRQALLLLLAAGVVLPLAASQGSGDEQIRQDIVKREGQDITFYGHTFGYGRTVPTPMNTQFPAGEADYSIGSTLRCGNPPPLPNQPLPPQTQDCRTNDGNEAYWYTTAGFVQVKSSDEWGGDYGKFHNERGMTQDVYLDTSKPASALYHMSADYHGWLVLLCQFECWNWDPGVYLDWVVEATVWHAPLGELHANASTRPNVSPVFNRAPSAVRVANGQSAPTDMMSFDDTVPVVGGRTVWPHPMVLKWDPGFIANGSVIPKEDNIIVEWEWYQLTDNPTGGQNMYILGGAGAGLVWNINSGEDYPSNIVLPVRNPLDVELVYPQFIHEKLVVVSIINTPWGSYDVDPPSIIMTVRDSSGNVIPIKDGALQQVLEQSVAHSGHYNPIKPTWVWDYKSQDLKPGDYTVTVSVRNFQHSVDAETTATFTLEADGGGTSREGRSGFQTLSGNLHAGHEGTAADPNAATSATSSDGPAPGSEGKGAPALGILSSAAILALAAAIWRRVRA